MARFRIEIAGCAIAVSSLFESTRDYCRHYLTDREGDFFLKTSPEDLILEQKALDDEAREEGLKRRKFPDPFLERSSLQRRMAARLLGRDILLVHGSTVAVDGRAYLFTAACGTGKSTHTRLWRETFGSRAQMVNDDKPFLRITDGGVLACGAPWSGKHGLDTNITVPLQGICILERGSENRIRPITAEEAMPMLIHQGCPPPEEEQMPHYLGLVAALANKVPLWRMSCTPEPQAAVTAWEAMSGAAGKTLQDSDEK